MTKVKICGITNIEDARRSIAYGADMLGFNFYPKSPRYVLPTDAQRIGAGIPGDVAKIGVFVSEDVEKIAATVRAANLDGVQLHGDESPEFVRKLRRVIDCNVIKAFRVSDDFVAEQTLQYEVDGVLLDGFAPGLAGGTGETFDWNVARDVSELGLKLYLAGGLSADNVQAAIRIVRPFAVDACSLLESRAGTKDDEKLRRFIMEAKRDD